MTTIAIAREKPSLRGKLHLVGGLFALPAVGLCIAHAAAGSATRAAAIYGASLIFLLFTSAIYHTPTWSDEARMLLRRIDHAAIFVLIAGTYTPFCLLVLPEGQGDLLLYLVWGCAAVGTFLAVFWPNVPRLLNVILYIAMGWMVVGSDMLSILGAVPIALLLGGGVLYSLGGLAYARRWPDPHPKVYGYHEVFHTFVLLAVAAHFAAVWGVVA